MIKEKLITTFVYDFYDATRTFLKYLFYSSIPRKWIISERYKKVFGKELNWEHPHDLNEKINWLKLYSDTSKWSDLSDKYKVREYVIEKGLGRILVPLYGKWDNPDDIDFSILPNSFVLKSNHGSNDIIIVRDKSKIDRNYTLTLLRKAYRQKFGLEKGEFHYLPITPCVIAEQLLEQNDPWTTSIVDYKIWCFSGKPAYIWTCYSRTKKIVYVETRDLNWGYHPEKSIFTPHYRDGKGIVPKPKCLDDMLFIASVLSEGFPEVRVDLYEIEGKVYFGELTFASNAGYNNFYSQDFLNELGGLIKI